MLNMSKRKAKIISYGEIIMDENCNFDELAKDIFECFTKHNAIANFRIYELLPNEKEIKHNNETKSIVEEALEKRKNRIL